MAQLVIFVPHMEVLIANGRFGSIADLQVDISLMSDLEGKADVQVPTLVPKPGSPLATFEVKRLGFLNLVP